mgnify:CR=1 FL=1
MKVEPALIRFRDGTMTFAKKYQNVADNLTKIMKIKIEQIRNETNSMRKSLLYIIISKR